MKTPPRGFLSQDSNSSDLAQVLELFNIISSLLTSNLNQRSLPKPMSLNSHWTTSSKSPSSSNQVTKTKNIRVPDRGLKAAGAAWVPRLKSTEESTEVFKTKITLEI
ncbi:hypothetical protein TNCV_4137931 [Trichonephila clavipes]|nr:hypothetical protein TNCV_4137931 [Trichonephila clavipes]